MAGQLLLGIDHLVRAAAPQEFFLDPPGGPGDDFLGPQLLEQVGGLQGALEVVPDGDDAGVEAGNVQGGEELLAGAVPNLGVGDKGEHRVHPGLLAVHRHHLVAQVIELAGDVLAEASQANEQN